MEKRWFIDALDAKGGRAFVSLRDVNLEIVDDLSTFQQSCYIAAPSFEPEVLSGASISLSSTRGAFQDGLYDDEGEVPFPSLEAVVDFIRRAYLSGGGGSSPDDEGPAPPEDGGPDGEGPLDIYDLEDAREGLRASSDGEKSVASRSAELQLSLSRYPADTSNINREKPMPLDFSSFRTSAGGQSGFERNPSERLIKAATVSWLDILHRAPISTSDVTKWRHWWSSVSALTKFFEYLRLHEYILMEKELALSVVDRAADHTSKFLHQVSNRARVPLAADWHYRRDWMETFDGRGYDETQLALLHWLGPRSGLLFWQFAYKFIGAEDIREAFHYFYRRRRYFGPEFAGSSGIGQEIAPKTISLHKLPMPSSLSNGINFGTVPRNKASLFNYMSVCFSTTDEVFSGAYPAVTEARFDLLLLVACVVVGESDVDQPSSWWMLGGGVSSILKAEIEDQHNVLTEKALNWICASLPQFVFTRSIEEIIGAARKLEYR